MSASITRKRSFLWKESTRVSTALNAMPMAILKNRWCSPSAWTATSRIRTRASLPSARIRESARHVTRCRAGSRRNSRSRNMRRRRIPCRVATLAWSVRSATFRKARTLYSKSNLIAAQIAMATGTRDSLPPRLISTLATVAIP